MSNTYNTYLDIITRHSETNEIKARSRYQNLHHTKKGRTQKCQNAAKLCLWNGSWNKSIHTFNTPSIVSCDWYNSIVEWKLTDFFTIQYSKIWLTINISFCSAWFKYFVSRSCLLCSCSSSSLYCCIALSSSLAAWYWGDCGASSHSVIKYSRSSWCLRSTSEITASCSKESI